MSSDRVLGLKADNQVGPESSSKEKFPLAKTQGEHLLRVRLWAGAEACREGAGGGGGGRGTWKEFAGPSGGHRRVPDCSKKGYRAGIAGCPKVHGQRGSSAWCFTHTGTQRCICTLADTHSQTRIHTHRHHQTNVLMS